MAALGKERALCVYRTVEECLANVRRHGAAGAPVLVRLRRVGTAFELTIQNSLGPRGQYNGPTGGMGLNLLAERIRVHGGVFHAQALEGLFVVSATLD